MQCAAACLRWSCPGGWQWPNPRREASTACAPAARASVERAGLCRTTHMTQKAYLCIQCGVCAVLSGDAEHRVELVHVTQGGKHIVVLGTALAVVQAGCATVAGACVDLHAVRGVGVAGRGDAGCFRTWRIDAADGCCLCSTRGQWRAWHGRCGRYTMHRWLQSCRHGAVCDGKGGQRCFRIPSQLNQKPLILITYKRNGISGGRAIPPGRLHSQLPT